MAITIKEIAKLAGVSKSTVSRVINDSEHVSDKAREKVQQVIKETGYVPNSLAKNLKRNQTDTIGVVLPKINTSTFSSAVEGISNVMYQNGYNLLLTNTKLNVKDEITYLNLLKEKRVRGILFFATEITDDHLEALNKIDIPVVIIGQDTSEIFDFPCVIQDDFDAAKSIVNHLIQQGHQDIAYIGVEENDVAVGQLRKLGYFEALQENDLKTFSDYIYKGDFSIESGWQGMKKIINRVERLPSAVFAVTDRLALGAIKYLKQNGYQVPEDISIVGIGNSDISPWVDPGITTINYDHEQTGEEASQILLKYINGTKREEKKVMDYQIIKRDSVAQI
ncbi:substrate-binding domain-containing protein [Halanaerobacter jeridensis]|uniref:LacI family sucrose operon transcriptional repressor n=1 Tax=Halanaerobacter jeridensis TaxID=706427 RepID=A0A938XR18_9FIRM|nr:LacI family sucrose operon transcriptional repressor [Halanaerobacter jeridensis]